MCIYTESSMLVEKSTMSMHILTYAKMEANILCIIYMLDIRLSR